ncbi:hypothetical protein R6Q59_006918 [Mikania micrantha]
MFAYIVPVVIGETPDMRSIQNDIAVRLTGKQLLEKTESERADGLCKRFKNILEVKKKRILVTLDDVWPGKIELSKIGLTCPLPNGLKLLLTSRYSDICEQIAINAHSVHVEVNVLEKQEAEDFFFHNTNVSKEDTELYETGCEIVKRCGYLPLAIHIIGKHLRSKTQYLWKTTLLRLDANDPELNVQKTIKVSYDFIQPQVDKEVLLLCVLSFAWCGIGKLPSAIGKLVKLKLLDLTRCQNLRIDNGVFKNLKNLEELYMIGSFDENVRFRESNIKEVAMLSKQLFALEVEFVEKENLFEFFSFEKLDKFKIAIGGYFDYQLDNDSFVNKLKLVNHCNIDLHNCKIKKLCNKTEHLDLRLKDMIGLEEFHYDRHSFSYLKCLTVYDCSNMKYLFSVCVANGLKKLERLIIRKCPVLEALIKNDGSEINGVVELPQLLQLELYHLPNFRSIYPDTSSSMCALFNSQVYMGL